jgi:uncharacterized protein YoxC
MSTTPNFSSLNVKISDNVKAYSPEKQHEIFQYLSEMDEINTALDNVNSTMQKVTQELYSNVEQTENTDGFTGSDVEFEEVK